MDQIRLHQQRCLEQWPLETSPAQRLLGQHGAKSSGEAKSWAENYRQLAGKQSAVQLAGMSTARYCKKCKVVFDQIQPTDKCPGAHANFM